MGLFPAMAGIQNTVAFNAATWTFHMLTHIVHTFCRGTEATECTSYIAATFDAHTPMIQILLWAPILEETQLDLGLVWHGGSSWGTAKEFSYVKDFSVVCLRAAWTAHRRPNHHNEVACQCWVCCHRTLGRPCKAANAFGLSRQMVWKIVKQVCEAITVHFDPVCTV